MNDKRAIILAAGKGRRIADNINYDHKALLPVGSKSLILRLVENLSDLGFSITVCTGYKSVDIEKELKSYVVDYCYNPLFEVSNNIVSVWLAQRYLNENRDVLIISADLLLDSSILTYFINNLNGKINLLGDSKRLLDGDYYLSVKNGFVEKYGPNLTYEERNFEYVGAIYIKSQALQEVLLELNKFLSENTINCYFEEVLFNLNSKDRCLTVVDSCGMKWLEIDQYEDYLRACDMFK